MKICSLTLASDTRESNIGDAIRSVVDWVDLVVIIHLTLSGFKPELPDRTLEIAKEIAGEKYYQVDIVVEQMQGDVLRNFALGEAVKLGMDWAIICDSDDQFILNGFDIRDYLTNTKAELCSIQNTNGAYNKPLIFKLPTTAMFDKAHHENCLFAGQWDIIPFVRFKDGVKLDNFGNPRTRFGGDDELTVLQKQAEEDPQNPRWHYYMGENFECRGKWKEAAECHNKAIELAQNPDTMAWACFHISMCYFNLQNYRAALLLALRGMSYKPSYPEFPWLAGQAALKMDLPMDAMAWANIAMAHQGTHIIHRFGFRLPHAYFEGPYELMLEAMVQMGLSQDQICFIDKDIEIMKQMRINYCENGTPPTLIKNNLVVPSKD